MVWEWDLAHNRVFWGDNLSTVIGHPPDCIEPVKAADMRTSWERWDELIHPEDRGRAQSGLDHAIEQRAEFWADEYRFLRPDGYVWIRSATALSTTRPGDWSAWWGHSARHPAPRGRGASALLLHELSHRVKNTLTVVRVVAARSLSGDRGWTRRARCSPAGWLPWRPRTTS